MKRFLIVACVVLSACVDLNVMPTASAVPTMEAEIASGAVFELPEVAEPRPERCMSVTALASLHVRDEPAGIVIGWLLRGEKVTAGQRSGAWVAVTTSTLSGWAHGAYLAECE